MPRRSGVFPGTAANISPPRSCRTHRGRVPPKDRVLGFWFVAFDLVVVVAVVVEEELVAAMAAVDVKL